MAEGSTIPPWLIVIGGSAGALEPLKELISHLRPDLPAAVFVIIHTTEAGGNYMPRILSRVTQLPVTLAEDGEAISVGRIYIARAGRHLKLVGERMEVNRGPREHHTRPAVDVLFRSAARNYGERVIAVVLSGHGSDGTSGALAIRARGGRLIVQSPEEALARTMPQRAIDAVGADLVASAHQIGIHLAALAGTSPAPRGVGKMAPDQERVTASIQEDLRDQVAGRRDGDTSVFSCPDCGGVLWQMDQGSVVNFQCHIGHRYSPDTMLIEKTEQLEAALVAALRLLKEKAMILRQAAERARARNQRQAFERLTEQAQLDEHHAELLQRELLEAEPSSFSNVTIEDQVSKQQG